MAARLHKCHIASPAPGPLRVQKWCARPGRTTFGTQMWCTRPGRTTFGITLVRQAIGNTHYRRHRMFRNTLDIPSQHKPAMAGSCTHWPLPHGITRRPYSKYALPSPCISSSEACQQNKRTCLRPTWGANLAGLTTTSELSGWSPEPSADEAAPYGQTSVRTMKRNKLTNSPCHDL